MARGPMVRVEGAKELRRTMKAAGEDMGELKDSMAQVSRTVATAAIERAPRRSGALAASVKGNRAAATATVGTRLVYGGPIHWGWPAHNITAQPFIADAAQATEPTWLDAINAELNRILTRVHGD